jgi:serine/threonine protein kinase
VCLRDVKAGNIVSVGTKGTFKLIDMDSIFLVDRLWQQQQQHEQQQHSGHVATSTPPDSWVGPPAATLAAQAAADVAAATRHQSQQQQQDDEGEGQKPHGSIASSSGANAAGDAGGGGGGLNALSFAGTPENMAPEAAPLVLEAAVVLWDLIPWREGRQVASAEPEDPARDIWSVGTVLWEMVVGR